MVRKGERVVALDLCRGIAALAVAVPHYLMLDSTVAAAWESVPVLAVEVFFVLSGFVLAPQILYCLQRDTFANLKIFLVRRWMRTVPPYLVSLCLISILLAPVPLGDFIRYAIYSQNLYAQINAQDYYPIAWSLSVEEWFYVGFPLFMAAALYFNGRRDRRACAIAAAVFIALISIVRWTFGDMANWGEAVRRVVIFRVDAIAYGFLFYVLIEPMLRSNDRARYRPIGAGVVFVIAAAIACMGVLAIAFDRNTLSERAFPFYAAGFGIATVFFFYSLTPLIEARRMAVGFAAWLGRISYSAYLFHFVIARLLHAASPALPIAWQLAIYMASIGAFCSLFYVCFERPILSARPKYADVESTAGGPLLLEAELAPAARADRGQIK